VSNHEVIDITYTLSKRHSENCQLHNEIYFGYYKANEDVQITCNAVGQPLL